MLGPWKGPVVNTDPAVNTDRPDYNGLAPNDLHQTSPSNSPVLLGRLQPATTYRRKQSIVSSLAE